jgi:hypothetical protein
MTNKQIPTIVDRHIRKQVRNGAYGGYAHLRPLIRRSIVNYHPDQHTQEPRRPVNVSQSFGDTFVFRSLDRLWGIGWEGYGDRHVAVSAATEKNA